MEVCKVCRLSIDPANRTVMAAFGRPLFVVHREPCSRVVHGGVVAVGRVALAGANMVLKARAPKAFALLEGVRAVARRTANDDRQQQ